MSITIIDDSNEPEEKKQEQVDVAAIVEATAAAVADAVVATKEAETVNVEDLQHDQAYYFSELKTLVESINNKIDMLISIEIDEAKAEIIEELTGGSDENVEPEQPAEPSEPEIVGVVADTIDNPAETIVELTSKPEGKQWI